MFGPIFVPNQFSYLIFLKVKQTQNIHQHLNLLNSRHNIPPLITDRSIILFVYKGRIFKEFYKEYGLSKKKNVGYNGGKLKAKFLNTFPVLIIEA